MKVNQFDTQRGKIKWSVASHRWLTHTVQMYATVILGVCVCICVCLRACVRVCVCVHISRSQANICPPQHSWDVMSPAFNRDDLLSTHSLPTDGQPLSAGRPALRHTDTQIRARLQANVPERNVRKRRAQTDLTHTD